MTPVAEHVTVLADHSVLLAIPAFAPAIVVVGVVIWVAMRDRRNGDDETDADDSDDTETAGGADDVPSHRRDSTSPGQDGAP
jgi:hypothetical protein